ncbi:MAG: hypothetical protein AAGC60_10740 [Acidobacteriota bacterium]
MPKIARLLIAAATIFLLSLLTAPAVADGGDEGWCRKDVDYITTRDLCLAQGGEWFGSSVPPNG